MHELLGCAKARVRDPARELSEQELVRLGFDSIAFEECLESPWSQRIKGFVGEPEVMYRNGPEVEPEVSRS